MSRQKLRKVSTAVGMFVGSMSIKHVKYHPPTTEKTTKIKNLNPLSKIFFIERIQFRTPSWERQEQISTVVEGGCALEAFRNPADSTLLCIHRSA
jgi:hypothetical protein